MPFAGESNRGLAILYHSRLRTKDTVCINALRTVFHRIEYPFTWPEQATNNTGIREVVVAVVNNRVLVLYVELQPQETVTTNALNHAYLLDTY